MKKAPSSSVWSGIEKKKPRSKTNISRNNKNRGRSGQQEVVALLKKYFPTILDGDIKSTPMGAPGEDIWLSAAARKLIGNYQIEVKRKKKLAIMSWLQQAEGHGEYAPLVLTREDGTADNWVVILKAEDFFALLPNAERFTDEANKE